MSQTETDQDGKKDRVIEREKPLIGFRWILIILGFFIYFIQYFNRNSLAVALVAMVNSTKTDSNVDYSRDTCSAARLNNSEESGTEEGSGEFYWTNSEQGIIIGAFYWGNVLSRVIGSRIGEVIGQRATVAFGIGASGTLVLVCPFAASLSPYVLASVRLLIGIAFGPIASAVMSLLAAWAPRSELSSMSTSLYAGAALGGTISYIMSGWLTDAYGWKTPFWVGGFISFLFLPFWITLIRNSPKEHPWLSPYEREMLEENKHITTKPTVPWMKIITSPYTMIFAYCYFARVWLDVLISADGPSYLTYKIGLDLRTASYVCGAGYLCSMVAVIFMGRISDMIVNRNIVKKIYSRKIFHILGTGVISALLVGLCIADCNTIAVIVIFDLIGIFSVATACSTVLSVIDIAPNYTATVSGLSGIGSLGSAIAPIVTSMFLDHDNGWNKSFYLCALLNAISCIVYISFMTTEIQPWNFHDEKQEQSTSTKL